MIVTPTDILAPTYVQMLKALSGWLDKAAGQSSSGQTETLLSARLAPDMLPLSTQVRFACVQAQEGMFRVRGESFPPSIEILLNEGRDGAERPGTLEQAKSRIDETIALVNSLSTDAFDEDLEKPVAHALPNGMIFDLTIEQYARDWALAQFYFHVMTAYAILRNQGVDLGKADYVTHMFIYLRPGTMPSE